MMNMKLYQVTWNMRKRIVGRSIRIHIWKNSWKTIRSATIEVLNNEASRLKTSNAEITMWLEDYHILFDSRFLAPYYRRIFQNLTIIYAAISLQCRTVYLIQSLCDI